MSLDPGMCVWVYILPVPEESLIICWYELLLSGESQGKIKGRQLGKLCIWAWETGLPTFVYAFIMFESVTCELS